MAVYGAEAMTAWTIEDIASALKLEYRYVRERLTKRKDFPRPYQFGTIKRWNQEEVESWLQKRKI